MSFSDRAFHAGGDTIRCNLTTASTVFPLALTGAQPQVRVVNFSGAVAQVVFGAAATLAATFPTTAAAAPGYIIGPNEAAVLSPGGAVTHMAALCSSGTAALFVTPGEGY